MNKNKAKVILIYGAMAVGKLTIGKELAKKTGYKLTHNHLINDLIWSVFEKESVEANKLIESMRYGFYTESVKHHKNIIITHTYSHNYVSPAGLADPDYLKTLEKKLNKTGANVLFVHIHADEKEILKRVKNSSRKAYHKLTDTKIMKDYLATEDFKTSAPVKNNLVINNTNLSPSKVVKIIEQHLI